VNEKIAIQRAPTGHAVVPAPTTGADAHQMSCRAAFSFGAPERPTPTGVPFSTRGEFGNASADDRGASKQPLPTGVPTLGR
jgi:hypothetical protein